MSQPSPTPAPAAPARRVREVPPLKFALLVPLYWLTRLWAATLRWRISPEEAAWLGDTRTPLIVLMWHNRLFTAGELYRRYRRARPLAGLVSASGDGAWLAAYFRLAGMRAVRGSSSWRGGVAARGLLAELAAGADVAITPDGPRGPCYEIEPGAAFVARQAQTPLLLVSAHFSNAWRLKSWDGFYLPKPFSTVEVRTRWLDNSAALGAADDAATAAALKCRLMEITTD